MIIGGNITIKTINGKLFRYFPLTKLLDKKKKTVIDFYVEIQSLL